MMTDSNVDKIRARIAELQSLYAASEDKAKLLEQEARAERAKMAEAQGDVKDLGGSLSEAQNLSMTRKAMEAAEQSRQQAQTYAGQVASQLTQLTNALSDVEKLKVELQEKLRELNPNTEIG